MFPGVKSHGLLNHRVASSWRVLQGIGLQELEKEDGLKMNNLPPHPTIFFCRMKPM